MNSKSWSGKYTTNTCFYKLFGCNIDMTLIGSAKNSFIQNEVFTLNIKYSVSFSLNYDIDSINMVFDPTLKFEPTDLGCLVGKYKDDTLLFYITYMDDYTIKGKCVFEGDNENGTVVLEKNCSPIEYLEKYKKQKN